MFSIRYSFLILLAFAIYNEANGASCPILKSRKRMICYFASWAGTKRPAPANIQPEDFDPCLCTHVLYSFVNLRNSKLELTDIDRDLFPRMAKWKLINPFIKISISIGGWDEQSTHFTPMVATEENRQSFCQSAIDISRTYNFDGLDIDWEYPSDYQRDQYTATIRKCYDMFQQESQTSGKTKLLISAATAADGRMSSLDLPALNNLMDFINPMTYDIHGAWDGNNAHHSPLHGWGGAVETLQRYISSGISPEKLNLGLAGYGRATADPGPYTREYGVLAYYEVCTLLCKSWTSIYDDYIKAPKAVNNQGSGHVFYDDTRSMFDKAQYVMNSNIGGAFIWDTSLDDFKGSFCCQGNFPLISTVVNVFVGNSTYSTNKCCEGGNVETFTVSATTTNSGGIVTVSTISPSSGQSEVFGGCTPFINIVPHPTECNKFIRCERIENTDTYIEHFEVCPANLLFNPDIKVCDWPQNVVCRTYTYSTTPATTTVATTLTTTTVKIIGCDGTKQYGIHPTDCTKMLACSTGAELVCASGLAFDYLGQQCRSAAELNCNTGSISTTTTTTGTTSTVASTVETAGTIDPYITDYSKCSTGQRLAPHQTECNKFIRCERIENTNTYTEYIDVCPANLLFNPDIKVCDWPQNVVCRTYTYSTTTPTTTTTTSKIIGCDGTKQYGIHPTDCTKMLACSTGAELVCASGLAFDYLGQQCRPAAELNCNTGSTSIATITTTTTVQTFDPNEIDYTKCPSGQRYTPHPTDCSKFLQCEMSPTGQLVDNVIQCPGGLLFNNNIKVCDWSFNVVCVIQSTVTTTTPTTTTQAPTTASTTVSTTKSGVLIDAAPSGEYICLRDGLFPSPIQCNVYYECYLGIATKKSCPLFGTLSTVFDIYRNNCYFRSSAQVYPGCV